MGKQKYLLFLLIYIILFVFGLFIGLYIKINSLRPDFLQLKLIELLQLLIPVVIALIIASLINRKVFISHRRSEICLSLIMEFEKKIQKVNGYMYEYFEKKKRDLEQKIVALLKESSIDLNLITNVEKKKKKIFKYDTKIMKDAFFSFKEACTGTPFEGARKKVSEDEMNEINSKYTQLLAKTLECKLAIFE